MEASGGEDITRRDVRVLVEKIAEGAPILANRAVAALSKLCRFALDDDLIAASPIVGVSRPSPELARDRVLTADEVRKLWGTFDALERRSALSSSWRSRQTPTERSGGQGYTCFGY